MPTFHQKHPPAVKPGGRVFSLLPARAKLDEAVLDAYGWPHEISDEEILEWLLALNLERAKEETR